MLNPGEPMIPAAQVQKLAGITSSKGLKDLRDDMKIGRTRTGAPRPFSIVEAVVITLATRLITEAGLRRSMATAIAQQAILGVVDLLNQGEPLPQRWLVAARPNTFDAWLVAIMDEAGAEKVMANDTFSRLTVNITKVAEAVLDLVGDAGRVVPAPEAIQ
jgi:hypothetical protein